VRYINPHAHICVVNIKMSIARNVWANTFTIFNCIPAKGRILGNCNLAQCTSSVPEHPRW